MKSTAPAGGADILVVDDHAQARQAVADALRAAGHAVRAAASAREALHLIGGAAFDVILTDLRMPGMNGLEFIGELESRRCEAQVVMITAHASVETAVEAMRHGAFDYIEKPFRADQLEAVVARAIRQGAERRSTIAPAADGDALLGDSPVMQALRARIGQVAPTSETVLITGESGVGKELVAKALHRASRRAAGPLVSVNCPALSPQLMESELFGHERGAFTSADSHRVGRFELAQGGTLFLDEVTEIDLALQAKLLRVLQERCFERVGSSESRRADARVVAATNRDLRKEVVAGRFREDLYFRLAVVPLAAPPLRERRDDVPALADHFLRRAAERSGRTPCRLDAAALELLAGYAWPGNVRELENLMTRASILCASTVVGADDLRPWLILDAGQGASTADDGAAATTGCASATAGPPAAALASTSAAPVGTNLQEMERRLIEATLERYGGHRIKTAQALGIGVRTLTNKLRQYGYAPRARISAA